MTTESKSAETNHPEGDREDSPIPAAHTAPRGAVTRRQLLRGSAILGGSVLAGGAVGGLTQRAFRRPGVDGAEENTSEHGDCEGFGQATEPFYGEHQAGVVTGTQAHACLLGYDLVSSATRDDVVRLMRIITQDAARLTQGKPPLADPEPELAEAPARLTITVGWGPSLFERVGMADQKPAGLRELPPYRIDRLDKQWGQTDILIMVQGDNPTSISHASRVLTRQTRRYLGRRWTQQGFTYARGTHPTGTTMRNLMGQVDGTHTATTQASDDLVWCSGDPVHEGATTFVLRRIAMNLDTWDEVDRVAREDVMGRRLATGAPLTGSHEGDEPDFDARSERGFPVIASYAHIRRARPQDPSVRILRRGYNYDDPPVGESTHNAGLLFGAFQRSIADQYMPLQAGLAELDALNEWTTPIGSAVYYIPPGVLDPAGYLGQRLLA